MPAEPSVERSRLQPLRLQKLRLGVFVNGLWSSRADASQTRPPELSFANHWPLARHPSSFFQSASRSRATPARAASTPRLPPPWKPPCPPPCRPAPLGFLNGENPHTSPRRCVATTRGGALEGAALAAGGRVAACRSPSRCGRRASERARGGGAPARGGPALAERAPLPCSGRSCPPGLGSCRGRSPAQSEAWLPLLGRDLRFDRDRAGEDSGRLPPATRRRLGLMKKVSAGLSRPRRRRQQRSPLRLRSSPGLPSLRGRPVGLAWQPPSPRGESRALGAGRGGRRA